MRFARNGLADISSVTPGVTKRELPAEVALMGQLGVALGMSTFEYSIAKNYTAIHDGDPRISGRSADAERRAVVFTTDLSRCSQCRLDRAKAFAYLA
jgi:hypothetical protein